MYPLDVPTMTHGCSITVAAPPMKLSAASAAGAGAVFAMLVRNPNSGGTL
jgi:hypothetical protein